MALEVASKWFSIHIAGTAMVSAMKDHPSVSVSILAVVWRERPLDRRRLSGPLVRRKAVCRQATAAKDTTLGPMSRKAGKVVASPDRPRKTVFVQISGLATS